MKQHLMDARKDRGWSRSKLAGECGVSEQSIKNYELGKANPSIETKEKIFSVLGEVVFGRHPELKERKRQAQAISKPDSSKWKPNIKPLPAPKHDSWTVAELARERTVEAIDTLTEIMRDKGAPPQARMGAANALLDRGWGKPAQQIDIQAHLATSPQTTIIRDAIMDNPDVIEVLFGPTGEGLRQLPAPAIDRLPDVYGGKNKPS